MVPPPLGGPDGGSLLSNGASYPSARSIYPRGPNFPVDTFSGKDFMAKDFVESLSDGAAPANRRSQTSSQAFDPKPYIRSFEHALNRLDGLSEDRGAHEGELAVVVRKSEQQHKQHCETLQTKLDQALYSFSSLETRLDASVDRVLVNGYSAGASGGAAALQIGERLEEFGRQKERAEDAKFLIDCWQEVNERGELTKLEDNMRNRIKSAKNARQLLKISSALGSEGKAKVPNGLGVANVNGHRAASDGAPSPGTRRTAEIIEKFLEKLEKDLLDQFEAYSRQRNEHGMRECAGALQDFNNGASVTARFVNQHEFFLERSAVMTDEIDAKPELWDRLADPDAEPPGVESSLQSLVEEVKFVVEEESFRIKQVFPQASTEDVMTTFIQRIFQQSIQQKLEVVLEKAASISAIAFLRSLQAARSLIGGAVEEMKTHGLTAHPEPATQTVGACLDQQLEDLFIPYFSGSSYLDRERRCLEELYASLLFRFTLYQSKKRKVPTSYLGSIGQRGRELLTFTRDTYLERLESTELPTSQKSVLLRIADIRESERNKTEIEVSDEDGALQLQVAKRMLKWMGESVGRCLELGGGSDSPRDVSAMLRLLITHMADIYVDSALDMASDSAISQENTKSEPDMAFIQDVQVAVSILKLMDTVVNPLLLTLARANVTVRRDMEKTFTTVVTRMEEKISAIRARTIDAALSWVAKLLGRQNRGDFRPKDDALGMEQLQTPTCASIFAFLAKVRDMTLKGSEGKNSEAFFTDLAVGVRSLLLDHLKKFQVNLAGGLMVSKDITKYIELLRTFPLAPSFMPTLEVLVEVGNIFVIGPEALKDRLRGGSALTGVERADLRPYILRREDANSIGVQSALNAL